MPARSSRDNIISWDATCSVWLYTRRMQRLPQSQTPNPLAARTESFVPPPQTTCTRHDYPPPTPKPYVDGGEGSSCSMRSVQ